MAATYEGDLGPITEVVLDKRLDEFARAMPIEAVANLVNAGQIFREEGEAWFAMLFEKLERKESYCWTKLALCVADLRMVALLPQVKKAFERGFCDEMTGGAYPNIEIAAHGGNPWEKDGLEWRPDFHPIEVNAAEMICGWAYYKPKKPKFYREGESPIPGLPMKAAPKVGRNDPCPCGSGKKFKKCCGGA